MSVTNVLNTAGAGAAAGAGVGGPLGAGIGGAIGLLGGFLGEYENAQNEKERRKIIERAAAELNESYDNTKNLLEQYYKNNESVGQASDILAYRDLVQGYDPNEFVYGEDKNGDGVIDEFEFDYDKSIDDFYAPNRQNIIDKTADTVQARAAGAGIGRGTGAANQIATAVADKNEELYRDALNAFNQDRGFAYNLWNAKIQQGQNRLNQLKGATDTQMSLYGNLAQDYQNWQEQQMQNQLDLENQKAQNKLQLTLAGL